MILPTIKLRIVLIMPTGAIHRYKGGMFKRVLRYAPLTLTTLAALVPKDLNAEIKIVDEGIEVLDTDFEADIVGITAITGTAMRAYQIADIIRAKGIRVVLGGVHPSLLPDEALQHADSVVVGFAEETWPQLLYDFCRGEMKPIYVQPRDATLSFLPHPRRDLLKQDTYITTNSVYASRGCPNTCDFCVIPAVWGRKVYFRPIDQVIHEIAAFKGDDFVLIDPNLVAETAYAKQFFKELAVLKKRWYGLATTEITKDRELFKLIIKSGCKGVFLGFETVDQSTLNVISKDFNLVRRYGEVIEELHDNNIIIQGAFVFGFDHDDASVFERTVDFVYKYNIDLPRFSVLTPFPRTKVYNDLAKENRIIERDWALYDSQHVVYEPRNMTCHELENGLHWAWRKAYSIPSIIKRIAGSRTAPGIAFMTNIGYRHYSQNLSNYTKQVMTDRG